MTTVYALIIICVIAYLIMHIMSFRQFRRLLAIAKLSVFANFRVYKKQELMLDEANLFAAATTNFLFAEPLDMHQSLNIVEIDRDAFNWMQSDKLLRELIVQSIRVRRMMMHFKSPDLNAKATKLLKLYDKEFTHAPTLESYEALVQRYLNSVDGPSQHQLRIRFDF